MNTKHISLSFAAAAALLAGCAKSPIEEVKTSEQFTDLELAYVGAIETKAAIDGTTFPTEGEIGLFLFKDEQAETPYGDSCYTNVKYSYNSDKERWTASPAIKVGSTPGYLYGYSPYKSGNTDVKEIPVASSLNGDDVMYATPVKDVTDATASQTAITMNHALARVSITVINNGYTGKAELSKIKFSGAKIAQEGTLNALDGKITATNSDVTLDVPTSNQTITTTGSTYECLLVPSGEDESKQAVDLTLTIDGEDKTAKLSGDNGVIIAQSTKSNITITLSNSGISVQTVSVKDWNVVEVGGYKVTVKFADDVTPYDILTEAHVDGDKVIVKAISLQNRYLVCKLEGDAQCERTIANGKFTFTISNIGSNIEAVLGYSIVTISVSSDSNGKVWIGDDESKTSGKFYEGQQVVIHAAPNDKFRLYRWNDNNKESSRTITIGATDVTYSAKFILQDVIPGLFTVDSNGKQVFFSKGNLYCSGVEFNEDGTVESIANAQWGFEANQYDTTPSSSGDRDTTHISHFMWCSDATNAMALNYEDGWKTDTPFFAAKNFTVNGYSGWCTLSNGEWNYLLATRKEDNKFAKANINGMSGLLIFPDGYTLPSGYSSDGGIGMAKVNDTSAEFPLSDKYMHIPEDIPNETWSEMEATGVVFLPAAGWRGGGDGDARVGLVGGNGYYWSASLRSGVNFYDLCFSSGSVDPNEYYSRNTAQSVRLVTECQSEPSAE